MQDTDFNSPVQEVQDILSKNRSDDKTDRKFGTATLPDRKQETSNRRHVELRLIAKGDLNPGRCQNDQYLHI